MPVRFPGQSIPLEWGIDSGGVLDRRADGNRRGDEDLTGQAPRAPIAMMPPGQPIAAAEPKRPVIGAEATVGPRCGPGRNRRSLV